MLSASEASLQVKLKGRHSYFILNKNGLRCIKDVFELRIDEIVNRN